MRALFRLRRCREVADAARKKLLDAPPRRLRHIITCSRQLQFSPPGHIFAFLAALAAPLIAASQRCQDG